MYDKKYFARLYVSLLILSRCNKNILLFKHDRTYLIFPTNYVGSTIIKTPISKRRIKIFETSFTVTYSRRVNKCNTTREEERLSQRTNWKTCGTIEFHFAAPRTFTKNLPLCQNECNSHDCA